MSSMIIIQNTLVSEDILDAKFRCEFSECCGACCVEGDAGAPLEKSEIEILEREIEKIKPFMSVEGLNALSFSGVYSCDLLGNLVTSLIHGKECVFTIFENNVARCAIEKAFFEKEIGFQKPISCHLYPVRISRSSDYDTINVHQWSVCINGWKQGKGQKIYLYKYIRDALIRKYGAIWYRELEEVAENWQKKTAL